MVIQTGSSMLAGATSSLITNPLDLIKTRIQVREKKKGAIYNQAGGSECVTAPQLCAHLLPATPDLKLSVHIGHCTAVLLALLQHPVPYLSGNLGEGAGVPRLA
eukprot:1160060-Pelagomonas_calceolata.AAC.7